MMVQLCSRSQLAGPAPPAQISAAGFTVLLSFVLHFQSFIFYFPNDVIEMDPDGSRLMCCFITAEQQLEASEEVDEVQYNTHI